MGGVPVPAAGRAATRDRRPRARARLAGGRAAASRRSPRCSRSSTSSTCCRPGSRIRRAADRVGDRHRLPDPVGERADGTNTLFEIPIFKAFPNMDTMVAIVIFAMMAIGLNIVVGYAGLLDLGYVAFYAIGAYIAAWLASPHFASEGVDFEFGAIGVPQGVGGIHISIWIVLVAAAITTAIAGRAHRPAHAPPAGRLPRHRHAGLRGDHPPGGRAGERRRDQRADRLADGLQPHERCVRDQPRRPAGLRGLAVGPARAAGQLHRRERLVRELRQPRLLVGDRAPADHALLQHPAAGLAARACLDRDPRGRGRRRRDGDPADADEDLVLCGGAFFGGVAGAWYGSFKQGVFPDDFLFNFSIFILCMVILGGMGNVWGAIAGAALLTYLGQGRAVERGGVVQREGLRPVPVRTPSRRIRPGRSARAA